MQPFSIALLVHGRCLLESLHFPSRFIKRRIEVDRGLDFRESRSLAPLPVEQLPQAPVTYGQRWLKTLDRLLNANESLQTEQHFFPFSVIR